MKVANSHFALVFTISLGAFTHAAPLDRTVLPIAEPLRETTTTLDVRKATQPPRFEVKAPEGAPNVATPTFHRIAGKGLTSAASHRSPPK